MAVRRPIAQRLSEVILVLNAGSSSLKFGLFEWPDDGDDPRQIALGVAHSEAGTQYRVSIASNDAGLRFNGTWAGSTADQFVTNLLEWIDRQAGIGSVVAVGHRIVHSGPHFCALVAIDERVLERLEALVPLAPLHQPACLAPIRSLRASRPGMRQIACFDTAFHCSIEPPAGRYALPRQFEAEGIRHYGFHGLSFESIAAQLRNEGGAAVAAERIILAHLGSGASLCALRGLRSVDTTMGFSTLDGLVMGTRPGALDPGILLYLMKARHMSPSELERLLYRQSGLLGVSGISPDVDELLASDAPAARDALDLFAFQVARQAGALAATLGGLDRFVFTGGIGENAPAVRRMIVDRLTLFGARLDRHANAAGDRVLSRADSCILIEKRGTQEELAIAGHVLRAMKASAGGRLSNQPMGSGAGR
jgi:acetate kinase